ncbi:NPCBM/NEW2 domain-containing protein [Amycolatopsis azurea]|uniref:Alpha-galactosidase n=1 Tax=Amycolatopsis azurea DSM 43854 TaxID=1238180 RepID=M2QTA1_9PSEU|nr:NPCBM/NEW2 domain-containing protein [Amycolatopsis azurea]EMD29736.1 Alpha-galactosidase precursor [Amycolatopsis azurea DSM 43854]OOC07454.1 alpha-galactosidase [Amycolatopsis azurea DSM 43854]
MRLFAGALVAACTLTALYALPATAAESESPPVATPPMGWNSWNKFGCDINEQLIRETADAMVSSGMKAAGYQYVNIDDCWAEKNRTPDGKYEPHRTRFPSGIKALADYVHGKGLKLGIYTSAGTETCARTMPGSLDHEEVDARTFAEWGVDYLKYDNCNNQGRPALERYTKMGEALKKTSRPIVYALCEWGQNKPWEWGRNAGAQLWRTTGDITDTWASVMNLLDQQVGLEAYSGPGGWNDPDMLEVGNGGMTDTEYRSHFALWSLLNAPLLAGNDLRSMSEATKKILLNKDLLAVNQDWGGKQGHKVRDDGDTEVWAKPMSDGSNVVVLFNRGGASATVSATAKEIGAPASSGYRVRDLWSGTETESAGTLRAGLPSHGSATFRVWPSSKPQAAPHTTLSLQAPEYVATDKPFTTTLRVFNDGRTPVRSGTVKLTVGAGWKPDGGTEVGIPVVAPGKSWERSWTVRPSSPSGDHVEVSGRIDYRTAWGARSLTTRGSAPLVKAPAAGTSALSKAAFMTADNGYGPVERGTSNGESGAGDGRKMSIGGVTYDDGLGVHAPSKVRIYLGGGCTSFTSSVGVDDEKAAGSVAFEVLGDGKRLANTGVLKRGQAAEKLSVPLGGVQVVDLVVTDGGDGVDSDHADWAGATLSC